MSFFALPRRLLATGLASIYILPAGLAGQATTWIVDRNAGPGHDFTTIGAGIAAARTGDTVLVRAGGYSESDLLIDVGITLVGEGTVELDFGSLLSTGLRVQGLPAGETFTLRGIDLDGSLSSASFTAADCIGPVHVDDVTGVLDPSLGVPESISLSFTDCEQVDVRGVFVRRGGIGFERSRGTLRSSTLEGGIGTPLGCIDSEILVDQCAISLGQGLPFVAGPVVQVSGGRLRLTRSSVTSLSPFMSPAAAIGASNLPCIEVDPNTSLNPSPGQPEIDGAATVTHPMVSALDVTFGSMADTTIGVQGPDSAPFAVLLSAPAAAIPLPDGLFDGASDFWVEFPTHFVAASGVLIGRTSLTTLDSSALPVGFTLVGQAVLLDGTTLVLSNGNVLTFTDL